MQFDIIIVGAGAAGLYTALCLPQHLRVAIVSKDELKIGASDWAQGGVAAAIAPGDSTEITIRIRSKPGLDSVFRKQ